jgi:hypothetical protein
MKLSELNYDPILDKRKSRKRITYICNICSSAIIILDDCDINAFNNGKCFACKNGIFVKKDK